MDVKTIKQLAELMGQYNLNQLDFQQAGDRVVLTKDQAAQPKAKPAQQPVEKQAAQPKKEADFIKSPLVGTFYRSASPESQPFVTEGTPVEAGTVVCIVEAMKVMNEIKAEKAGIITKVMLENSSPVEFGQPLFELQ